MSLYPIYWKNLNYSIQNAVNSLFDKNQQITSAINAKLYSNMD